MIEMRVLGSGSTGNCTLVRLGGGGAGRLLMIDAGLGPRTVAKRLELDGQAPGAEQLERLDAVLLTHLDRDHFNPAWFATLKRLGATVYCHEKHLYGLYRHPPATREQVDARVLHRLGLLRVFKDDAFVVDAMRNGDHAVPGPRVQPVGLVHDRSGVFGFELRVTAGDVVTRLGFATDLGRISSRLIEAFCDVDLLAIESNYDPEMQQASGRPMTLKRRIMGGRGHLSNEQCLEAVRRIAKASRRLPAHIVLLHLSRQCNCPHVIERLYAAHPELAARLRLTHHLEPTPWLRAQGDGRPPPAAGPTQQQLSLF